MRTKKKAKDVVEGDKVYTTEAPNRPMTVTASYPLGTNWGLEVDGIKQILQSDPEAEISVWGS